MVISKKIKLSIIALGIFLALATLLFIKSDNKPYGPTLEITNIEQYTEGKPSNNDRLEFIKSKLHKVVQLNVNFEVNNETVSDVEIREGSFSQKLNTANQVHEVRFIVDIASIKQSYAVAYQWQEETKYSEDIDQYGTQVTCLPVKELVYAEFDCKDERILEVGVDNFDSVGLLLPYVVRYKYEILTYVKNSDKTVLNVSNPYIPARGVDPQTVLEEYKKEIRTWLMSEKLDPDKYEINFAVRNEFSNIIDYGDSYGGDGIPPEEQP